MRPKVLILLLISLVVIASCKRSAATPPTNAQQPSAAQQTTSPPPGPASSASQAGEPLATAKPEGKPKTNACALLTSKDIKPVQGEALKETKLSESSGGGFSVSQCFFTLPTFNNSISLAVTRKGEGLVRAIQSSFGKPRSTEKRNAGSEAKRKNQLLHST